MTELWVTYEFLPWCLRCMVLNLKMSWMMESEILLNYCRRKWACSKPPLLDDYSLEVTLSNICTHIFWGILAIHWRNPYWPSSVEQRQRVLNTASCSHGMSFFGRGKRALFQASPVIGPIGTTNDDQHCDRYVHDKWDLDSSMTTSS